MFCERCAQLKPTAKDRAGWNAGADRFGRLLCQRCGALLSGYGSGDALKTKLTQLERFGLAGFPRRRPAE